ncbi:MAG: MATE family efflux transporter [Muribaculaceae bacterium]|nr:MATE family efflux transporter [Muribaculaceae bacterium]
MVSDKEIIRSIRRITGPAIVSNITTPLLGLVDVAITGHLGSAAYIGAIAVGTTMFNMLYWLFGFLRMGTAGLTSQSAGADDTRACDAHLQRSLLLALLFGLCLIALGGFLKEFVLDYLQPDEVTRPLAARYFNVLIWGAPATLGLFALNGWQLGMQNSQLPMVVAVSLNLVNIILSAILVFGFGMQMEGVATGTLVAQWFGFLFSLIATVCLYGPKRARLRELLEHNSVVRLFKVNADIFLRTLCLVAVTTWFTRAGSEQGVDTLAANALLMQLFIFFSYFSDGYAYAGEALAGKFYGAHDIIDLRRLTVILLKRSAVVALIFTAAYFIAGELIFSLLTDNEGVRAMAADYKYWVISIPVCSVSAFIFDGIAVGLTHTRGMLVSMACAMLIFFLTYFTLRGLMGNHALWLAFLLYLAFRGLILGRILYPRVIARQNHNPANGQNN